MSLTCRHVVFDTETTGFRDARVVEVAAIEFNPETGETGERFHYYVNPAPKRVEPAARRVHGLDNRFLARHPAFSHVARRCRRSSATLRCTPTTRPTTGACSTSNSGCCSSRRWKPWPSASSARWPNRTSDCPGLSGRKLDHLCDHYGIDRSGRGQHGALVDCELLIRVIVRLRLEKPPPPYVPPPAPLAPSRTPAPPRPPGWCAGGPWYDDEVAALIAAHAAGQAIAAIAQRHNRSLGAIVLQLERQGRLSAEEAQRLHPYPRR